ncbi:type IV secretion system protein [Alterisphingorhabdus coralli]|uniref:Type IV secretion system protein n=1 Tax=Alterisphingorhabdus coralli TaxID=3071408 RepID=A0AA97I3F4_9SPHN|nr:type IV secretion system protein [Parasphingorhabdus sp. SCSIO 66989]WOE76745.1 type IV secretion system protein [Parasphingorhabdus sp. SCSIO 66989]
MFQQIYTSIDAQIATVIGGYGAVVGFAGAAVAAGIGVYMILACYAVLRGIAGEGFGHIISQGVKAGLVLAAVQSGIGGVAASSVQTWPDILVGMASAPGVDNAGQLAQTLFDSVEAEVNRVIDNIQLAPWDTWEPGPFFETRIAVLIAYLLAIFPIAAAGLLAAVVVAMVLFLKFAITATALFGPIFVGCLLFDSTRSMFFTWLQTALGYAIATAVLALAVGFIGTLTANFINDVFAQFGIDATAPIGTDQVSDSPFGLLGSVIAAFIGLLGVLFVSGYLILQAQSIGQGMSGGGGGSSAAVAGALIPSSYTTRNLLSGAGRGGSRAWSGRDGKGGIKGAGGRASERASAAATSASQYVGARMATSRVAIMRGLVGAR